MLIVNGEWLIQMCTCSPLRSFTIHHSAFIILLVFLLLSCGVDEQQRAVTAPPPQISIAAHKHDFGEVRQGVPIDHTFTISNRGGVDLTIDRMRTACGCDAKLDVERIVPPGSTAQLKVTCDTSTSFGKQRRTVSIYTNDPVKPVSLLRLTGAVRGADVVVSPSRFYVGRVHRGERVRRDGSARCPIEDAPVDVTANGDAVFRVDTAVPSSTGDRATFTLVINDDAPLGPIAGRLVVKSASAPSKRTVPVVGEVVADVGVSPDRAVIRADKSPLSASVMIHNAGPRSVHVTAAESPLGTATIETIDAGKRYRVVLTAQTATEGELIVRTDHPEQPVLRVPVVVRAP